MSLGRPALSCLTDIHGVVPLDLAGNLLDLGEYQLSVFKSGEDSCSGQVMHEVDLATLAEPFDTRRRAGREVSAQALDDPLAGLPEGGWLAVEVPAQHVFASTFDRCGENLERIAACA